MLQKRTTGAQVCAQLPLLKAINQGKTTIKALAQTLKLHRSHISRKLNALEKQGLIKKIGYPIILELTGRGKIKIVRQSTTCAFLSRGVRGKKTLFQGLEGKRTLIHSKKTRIHSLSIKFPILRDKSVIDWDSINERFINSVKKYKKIEFPIGITIEKTSKSVILYLHDKELDRSQFLTEFNSWVMKAVFFAYHYLKNKGLVFDFLEGEILQQHIANPEPDFEKAVDDKLTLEVGLGRKAQGLFPSQAPARAWIDRSLGELEIETNDELYEEKLVLMPEKVFELAENTKTFSNSLALYNKNIESHLAAIQEMRDTMKAIRESLQ